MNNIREISISTPFPCVKIRRRVLWHPEEERGELFNPAGIRTASIFIVPDGDGDELVRLVSISTGKVYEEGAWDNSKNMSRLIAALSQSYMDMCAGR